MPELLSVVVPCYNEQETIGLFYDAILKEAAKLSILEWEFLFVDDGSQDHTLDKIKELQELDTRVHYLSFSRNFGKEAAIYAGLRRARAGV